MSLTNAGRDEIVALITGESSQLFNNSNACIGVGDSNTAFSVAQTDLQAVTNKIRKGMDVSYPQVTGNVMVFRSTFGTTEANWAWNEWGVFQNLIADAMLNRVVEYNGTKLSGQTWVFQVTLTLEIGS